MSMYNQMSICAFYSKSISVSLSVFMDSFCALTWDLNLSLKRLEDEGLASDQNRFSYFLFISEPYIFCSMEWSIFAYISSVNFKIVTLLCSCFIKKLLGNSSFGNELSTLTVDLQYSILMTKVGLDNSYKVHFRCQMI